MLGFNPVAVADMYILEQDVSSHWAGLVYSTAQIDWLA